MIFNTWTFGVFLVLVLAVAWTIFPRSSRPFSIVAGVVFYAFSTPAYLAIVVALGVVTFVAARVMLAKPPAERGLAMSVGIALIAGTLGYFKYSTLLVTSIDQIARQRLVPLPHIVVPLAISFFTFEFVHVLVDVRVGKIATVDPLDLATFAFFFPTLVAGPIKRYESFVTQLRVMPPPIEADLLRNGYRVALGLFKKIVIADSLGVLTTPFVTPGAPFHRLDYWVAFFAYAGKIYFDFSGYSDIAIGVAGLLGFRIPENFDRPYRSANIQIFWRRWHISLSTWIRDYLFIPLGGSKRPAPVVVFNLLLAMALAGLWHGAAWTFVLWGLWHGVGLAVHRVWHGRVVVRVPALLRPSRTLQTISVAMTFFFVGFGWVLFATSSLADAGTVYHELLALN